MFDLAIDPADGITDFAMFDSGSKLELPYPEAGRYFREGPTAKSMVSHSILMGI